MAQINPKDLMRPLRSDQGILDSLLKKFLSPKTTDALPPPRQQPRQQPPVMMTSRNTFAIQPQTQPQTQTRRRAPVDLGNTAPQPVIPGNIDLTKQPRVPFPGSNKIATVFSVGVNINGREYLLPAVTPDGRLLIDMNGEADVNMVVEEFNKTGRHLGVFNSPEESTSFAKKLSKDYDRGMYGRGP